MGRKGLLGFADWILLGRVPPRFAACGVTAHGMFLLRILPRRIYVRVLAKRLTTCGVCTAERGSREAGARS